MHNRSRTRVSRRRGAVQALTLTALIVGAGLGAGCNNAGEGAVSGAGIGALGGLVIGSMFGAPGTGAAVGAIGGGIAGGVIGDQNARRRYDSGPGYHEIDDGYRYQESRQYYVPFSFGIHYDYYHDSGHRHRHYSHGRHHRGHGHHGRNHHY